MVDNTPKLSVDIRSLLIRCQQLSFPYLKIPPRPGLKVLIQRKRHLGCLHTNTRQCIVRDPLLKEVVLALQ